MPDRPLDHDRACALLDGIGVLRHPCDLDLLVFFARHPRSLMASEHLAALLGYGLPQIADSLEVLLSADLVTRTQQASRPARMYVLAAGATGDWLPPFLEFAATRPGRLAMRRVLTSSPHKRADDLKAADSAARVAEKTARRPFLVRPRAMATNPQARERRRGGA